MVAFDVKIAATFSEHCYSYYEGMRMPEPLKDKELVRRSCVADEHYIPTLLASKGLDDEVRQQIVWSLLQCCARSGIES